MFVVDWGVATVIGGRPAPTACTAPRVRRPEQLEEGARPDPRGDVWALGAILYEP